MKRFIRYPKTDHSRNMASSIRRMYDGVKLPTFNFTGTVKLHGTNAGVCFTDGELWFQSRKNIITPLKDNAGFAFFATENSDTLTAIITQLANSNNIDLSKKTICLFGEWAGDNIQKNVAIQNLQKSFFIFAVKVQDNDTETCDYWLDLNGVEISYPQNNIYTIYDFKTFDLTIDFNSFEEAEQILYEKTIDVENCCPVASKLGYNGIGEGIVWTAHTPSGVIVFKTKGDKHAKNAGKVKKVQKLDTEKLGSIKDFVNFASTNERFQQGISEVFGTEEPNVKKLGDLIGFVIKDIITEEQPTMSKNNLTPKDVTKYIAADVRVKFFNKY